jgi:hypothetical protein
MGLTIGGADEQPVPGVVVNNFFIRKSAVKDN